MIRVVCMICPRAPFVLSYVRNEREIERGFEDEKWYLRGKGFRMFRLTWRGVE